MADLAERGTARHNIDLFRLDRFTDRRRVDGHQRFVHQARTSDRIQPGFGDRVSTIAAEDPDAIKSFW